MATDKHSISINSGRLRAEAEHGEAQQQPEQEEQDERREEPPAVGGVRHGRRRRPTICAVSTARNTGLQ